MSYLSQTILPIDCNNILLLNIIGMIIVTLITYIQFFMIKISKEFLGNVFVLFDIII